MFDKEIALDSLKKIQTVIDTIIDRTSAIRNPLKLILMSCLQPSKKTFLR